MQAKHTLHALAFLICLLGCSEKENLITQNNVLVDIYSSTIPGTGTLNQDILMQLAAQAPNGCFSDLKINMTEIDDRHFAFTATANYRSTGACPEVLVRTDTVINFRPTSAGEYFFTVNQAPFAVRAYTVEVN